MAEATLLTADNGTEGSAAEATDKAAGASAPAVDAGADKAAGEVKPAEGDKPAEGADKAKEGAPEAYEYKLPEGYVLNDEAKGQFDAFARDLGLNNEQAQKLVDMHTAALKQTQDSLMEAITAQQEQWLADTKADKEIGGAKLKEVGAVCAQVIERLGTPGFKAALNETGIGNHPEMIRFVNRVGRELGIKEGQIVTNGSGAAVQKEAKNILFDVSLSGQQ